MASQITFSANKEQIDYELSLTEELYQAITMDDSAPLGGYVDINNFLVRLRLDGTFIEIPEMARLLKALLSITALRSYFINSDKYPLLKEIAQVIYIPEGMVRDINSIMDESGKIKDNASPKLAQIRSDLRRKEREVGRRLRAIMSSAISEGVVEEGTQISMREGRAVIPILAANKRKIKGLIHDESATGKTAYVEPMEVVEMNNVIKELESDEHREMVRILTHFTDGMRPHIPDLMAGGEFLARIDLLSAKCRLAMNQSAIKPKLLDRPASYIYSGRHPLLEASLRREGRNIVPLNIELTPDKHIVVISGPNAGGKSVCLKTVGLLQYMLQCGLMVPVSENSQMGVFDKIFVDIGDQQSIDNDLSTYSSHLLNMKMTLRHSDNKSLVLIDEFGTGTEPAMGGAIAETILERLEAKGVFGVITTHYSNLKYYASHSKGVQNGAMAFDVRHIRPLFSLELGKPGSSFAFEIARNSGLSEEVVKSAEAKLGEDRVSVEKQLREIARDKRYWQTKREKARVADRDAQQLAEQYKKELEELKESRTQLIRDAKAEAAKIVAEANRVVENTIRQIKEAQAEKERTRSARASLEKFKQEQTEETPIRDEKIERKMQKLIERQNRKGKGVAKDKKAPESVAKVEVKAIEAGSLVAIKGQGVTGEVIEVSGNSAIVAFGQMRTTVKLSKLEHTSRSQIKKQTKEFIPPVNTQSNNYDVRATQLEFKSSIDVRGMRSMEAVALSEKLVDEASMVGVSEVKILHGKGTGALKEEIRAYLRINPFVISFKDEAVDMGGAGITVVKVK